MNVDTVRLAELLEGHSGGLLPEYPIIRNGRTQMIAPDRLTLQERDAVSSWLRAEGDRQADEAAALREYLARRRGENVLAMKRRERTA